MALHSVKSGYQVARDLMGSGGGLGRKPLGAPSEEDKQKKGCTEIWRLRVPNKLKVFMWKCCNNAVAVRSNLQQRHMRVEGGCGICGREEETANHLFFECEFSKVFWFGLPVQLNPTVFKGNDFLERWMNVCLKFKEVDAQDAILQEIVFGFWRIWKCRIDMVYLMN